MVKRKRTLRPCRHCRSAHRNDNGYCDKHQSLVVAGWERTRKGRTTTERGYGWKWQQLRKRILKRDEYLCQTCLRRGRYERGTEVDHILAKSQGGADVAANLEAICYECHTEKTAVESRVGMGGGVKAKKQSSS